MCGVVNFSTNCTHAYQDAHREKNSCDTFNDTFKNPSKLTHPEVVICCWISLNARFIIRAVGKLWIVNFEFQTKWKGKLSYGDKFLLLMNQTDFLLFDNHKEIFSTIMLRSNWKGIGKLSYLRGEENPINEDWNSFHPPLWRYFFIFFIIDRF